ncbi:HAMP domain-containing sensor histidine kinase [Brassicibacter mesophilus]|uniref:HAMP domain-containing sensor histidine kinase n=1 Tax=Brassicibacter mesophilus TaxID=745119 RepID=UPI003D20E84C
MKNRPLAIQIWLFFAGVTLAILILLALFFSITLDTFFLNHLHDTIERSQEKVIEEPFEIIDSIEKAKVQQDTLMVKHMPLSFITLEEDLKKKVIISLGEHQQLPTEFLDKIVEQAESQTENIKRYTDRIGDTKIFYVIRKKAFFTDLGRSYPLFSFMWDTYQDSLVKTLFRRLMFITVMAMMICLIGAIVLSKHLTSPLVALEKDVKRIAKRDWYKPINIQRNDEIGRLAESIEWMREQLVIHDEKQQSFLQNISHELKTPVMVIRSYVNSIIDNIYPKGDMEGTLKVIDTESKRLEKRIRDLLYMTKLDYLKKQVNLEHGEILLKPLIEKVVKKFKFRGQDLCWELEMESIVIDGDSDQWNVVLENILDNQVRYGKSKISISLKRDMDTARLCISNDGPNIDSSIIDKIFQRFSKGEKGHYGMGLAIVKQIIEMHNGSIWAENHYYGVKFCMEIPIRDINL